jgi:hypothetical protein
MFDIETYKIEFIFFNHPVHGFNKVATEHFHVTLADVNIKGRPQDPLLCRVWPLY